MLEQDIPLLLGESLEYEMAKRRYEATGELTWSLVNDKSQSVRESAVGSLLLKFSQLDAVAECLFEIAKTNTPELRLTKFRETFQLREYEFRYKSKEGKMENHWMSHLAYYENQCALAFPSEEVFAQALSRLREPHLRAMPFQLVGNETIIVPEEASMYFGDLEMTKQKVQYRSLSHPIEKDDPVEQLASEHGS